MATNPLGGGPPAPPTEAFKILSAPSAVSFAITNLQPPTRVYIERDDVLRLDVITLLGTPTLRMVGRLLRVDGDVVPFEQDIVVAAANVLQTARLQMAEGFLLSVAVMATGAVNIGNSCYVQFGFERSAQGGNVFFDVLTAGYCGNTQPIAWPGYPAMKPTDGAGCSIGWQGSAPAAGADAQFLLPLAVRVRVKSIRATLTTSAAAGNRIPRLRWQGTNGGEGFAGPNNTQLASTVVVYTWFGGGPATGIIDPTAGNLFQQAAIPEILYSSTSGTPFLFTVTDGLLAGDQWSAISVMAESWIELV